jgi:hypothetical protein
MNDMATQMADAREDEISQALLNASQVLDNLSMIRTTADYAAEALSARGVNTARIRLREIARYAEEAIQLLSPSEDAPA